MSREFIRILGAWFVALIVCIPLAVIVWKCEKGERE